jgi:small ligand-binding sensory domain FIST
MKWSSAASQSPDTAEAIAEVVSVVRAELGPAPDLVVAFVSPHHQDSYELLPAALMAELRPRVVIGCSAGGVIGGGREIEETPGLSLTAAELPGVELAPFRFGTVSEAAEEGSWRAVLPRSTGGSPDFLLLADPFSFEVEVFLRGLDAGFSGSKIGGLASGGRGPGENVLYLGEQAHRGGVVGVALSGNVRIETLVAQGCRPIGEPMFVTRCRENVVYAVDGSSPIEVLQRLYARLEPRDRELFRHSLFVGVVMREKSDAYRKGDFLVRNIIGLDADRGELAVAARLEEGAVIQFHLRDGKTSAEDLEEMLSQVSSHARLATRGSLLFSCLGRGRQLYGRADHDTDAFRRHFGEVPLGGFFCNGEIGPVHGATFLHGYTSSFGLFRPKVS